MKSRRQVELHKQIDETIHLLRWNLVRFGNSIKRTPTAEDIVQIKICKREAERVQSYLFELIKENKERGYDEPFKSKLGGFPVIHKMLHDNYRRALGQELTFAIVPLAEKKEAKAETKESARGDLDTVKRLNNN